MNKPNKNSQHEIDSFELDLKLAKRLEAVEKGTLTPEQKEKREKMLEWLGVKKKKANQTNQNE